MGKEGQVTYLAPTPGLLKIATVGDGPIRLIHRDSIGRIFVASGNKLYRLSSSTQWTMSIDSTVYDKSVSPIVAREGSGFSVNPATDVVTMFTYDWKTGQKVQVSNSGGGLPDPLVVSTDYYVIAVTSSTIRLATSMANANAGTYIDITTTGTGTHTIQTNDPAPFEVSLSADIDYDTNYITETAHGYYTGASVRVTNQAFPLPSGLSFSTDYYIIVIDADTFEIASSLANALAGTAIDLSAPTGTWNASNVLIDEFDPSQGNFTFQTSTGKISAASMSYGGAGTDSSTLFTDGTYNYVFYDQYGLRLCFETSSPPSALGALTFAAGPGSSQLVWVDGYFIMIEDGTNRFWVSGLKDFDIDALDFSSSEGSPDLVVGIVVNNRNVYIFNEQTIEVFSNTGAPDFPFERPQGGFIEQGCVAGRSIAKINNTILWLGNNETGNGVVYGMSGSSPQRISTHAIETAISGYADISSASAYTYQRNGHYFYVLNFDEATWAYDLSTGLWHERAFTNAGTLERHRVEYHVFDQTTGLHIVGDYSSNEVYQFDDATYTDDGDLITRLRTSPHISAEKKRIFCSKFELDMEVGIGLDGGVQGSSPTVMLDFSDDGGHTWSSESYALADNSMGSIGEYLTRVIWRRLGSFRDRIFRVKITDPVKVILLGAEIDVEGGRS